MWLRDVGPGLICQILLEGELVADHLLELIDGQVAVNRANREASPEAIEVHHFVCVCDRNSIEHGSLVEGCVGNEPMHAIFLRVEYEHLEVG